MNDSESYWTQRYIQGQTGWDIGSASPALISFASSFPKSTRILIPGSGNAHEWIALQKAGYSQCYALDISSLPLEHLAKAFPEYASQLIHEDFFKHHGKYDLILEQTFFCALAPSLRAEYVHKMADLLSEKGKLVGLLFATEFEREGPPFGGTEAEYHSLFSAHLDIESMEVCKASIPARAGNELFFQAKKL